MRYLRFDSTGGASGDMILGALLALDGGEQELTAMLEQLIPGHFSLESTSWVSHGISGRRLRVHAPDDPHDHHDHHHHQLHDDPGGSHDHHDHHDHEEAHVHSDRLRPPEHPVPTAGSHHHHDHHHFAEIRTLIENSPLPDAVRKDAVGVFSLLAEAEGRVHNVPADEVAFHEVGAVDSLIDIVGSVWLYHRLGATGVAVPPLPTGFGTVKCAHGILPVPAPATLEVIGMTGLEVYAGTEPGELLTPTGAALLGYWPRVPAGPGRLLGSAAAFGTRELQSTPNLLRASLWEGSGAVPEMTELSCNLDDTTGERLGALQEQLLAAGAADVWCEALVMKKSRPGVKLCLLVDESARERCIELVLRESGSFGVRFHRVERRILDREYRDIAGRFGTLTFKIGRLNGRVVAVKPEFSSCLEAARRNQVPLPQVLAEAAATAAALY